MSTNMFKALVLNDKLIKHVKIQHEDIKLQIRSEDNWPETCKCKIKDFKGSAIGSRVL